MTDAVITTQLPLYEQVLGDSYGRLAAPIQAFHRLQGRHVRHGIVSTAAPASLLGKFLALCLGTPRVAESGAFRFVLEAKPEHELWTRHFPAGTQVNEMSLLNGAVSESLGMAQLTFGLQELEGALLMNLQSLRFAGIPCPAWLLPTIVAVERGKGALLEFTVHASLPLIGQIVSHTGHIIVDAR